VVDKKPRPLSRGILYLLIMIIGLILIYASGSPVESMVRIVIGIFSLLTALFFVALLIALPRSLSILFDLVRARLAMSRGDYDRVEARLNKALTRAEAAGRNRDRLIGPVFAFLADLRRVQGRYAESESTFKLALANYAKLAPSRRIPRANALCNLAVLYINQGRFAEAEPLCREALAVFERAKHATRVVVMLNLGKVLAGLGDPAQAEDLTRQALTLAEQQGKRGRYAQCIALVSLGDLYRLQGRLPEADALVRRGLECHSATFPASEANIRLRLWSVLSEILREQGQLDKAESICELAQQLIDKNKGGEYLNADRCLATLARIRVAQNRPSEAETLFWRCLAILKESAPEHPERVKRLTECAALLRNLERSAEAEQLETEAKAIPVAVLRA
jgi:tetratricopeptide (TPR) repeat protein